MKLEDFVAQTLKEIINGVKKAQSDTSQTGAVINTTPPTERSRIVEFDVAVTTTEGTKTEGGAGVFVGPIGLGTRGASDASTSSVSRVKFSVPVQFPGWKL